MGKFTKKPVTIEAVRFDGIETVDDGREPMFDGTFSPPEWLVHALAGAQGEPGSAWTSPVNHGDGHTGEWSLAIGTLEGIHYASPGDWIIRGIKGELYPCKPDIFAATYDAAGDLPRYDEMLPGDMLAAVGTDGMAWADAFMQTACMANPLGRELRAFPHGDRAPLHGTMLGWFCNAIEAGRAAGFAGAVAASPEMQTVFDRGLRGAVSPVADQGNRIADHARSVVADDGVVELPAKARHELSYIVRRFIDKHQISSADATVQDSVYAEAPELVAELGAVVGFYRHPDEEV